MTIKGADKEIGGVEGKAIAIGQIVHSQALRPGIFGKGSHIKGAIAKLRHSYF